MSSINLCPSETMIQVVNNLYKDLYSSGGWNYVTSIYNKRSAKDRNNYMKRENINVKEENLIQFMGATRKVYIDYIIKKVVNNLQDSYHINDYSEFLSQRNLVDVVQSNAFGSTNPTSDYDLTFAGPGVHHIIKCLLQQFEDPIFTNSRKLSLSEMFDSNFYIAPDLILLENKNKLDSIGVKLFLVNPETNHYVPVPSTENHFKREHKQLAKKISTHETLTHRTITRKYRNLIALNEALDNELYKNEGSHKHILKHSDMFIAHLLKMCESSIEAYYALSTILIVVYGMQAKKMDQLLPLLQKEHFVMAGLENIIDLVKHQSESFVSDNAIENKNLALKVSKYVQRVIYCLDNLVKYDERIDKDKLSDLKTLTDEIVYYRSNISSMGSAENERYQAKLNVFMDTFGLHKKLTYKTLHPLFFMLDNMLPYGKLFTTNARSMSHKRHNKTQKRSIMNKNQPQKALTRKLM